ncbi:CBS domain-containing protein [Reyranella sp.]|uniref:CBS domain-containing protein n=1 Tax=Reyranella sp. TaxID=1929291 RepID=UPI0012062A37|nr:CBS domain-containing protein [Reyranella sp.]TAJ89900.1 MAG: CBS domain-containing protein [Reyranella sp.]
MRARNVMTSEIVAAASSATLLEAVRELVNTNASALPVVDGGNQLIGLISEIDIIRHLLSIDNEAALFRLQFEAGMPMPDPIAKAFLEYATASASMLSPRRG